MEVEMLAVKEIIEALDSGKLQTEHSVQRKFVYEFVETNSDKFGKISKADKLINDVLDNHIQLGPIWVWKTGDNYNIHDGKQRILSLYNFVKGEGVSYHIKRNGREVEQTFDNLNKEQQDYILNYEFCCQVTEGDSSAEEVSFFAANTNGLPLIPYEAYRGSFYGEWLNEFEDYIEQKAKSCDLIKSIGRGEQAIKFLYILLNHYTDDSNLSDEAKKIA